MLLILRLALAAAGVYAVTSLAIMLARTARLGRPSGFALPAGSERAGIVYAFTRGMNPAEKDSSRNHVPTYAAGFLYHIGVFASVLFLLLVSCGLSLASTALWIIRALMLAGLVSGVMLLVKRAMFAQMRIISVPDDFLANVLVNLFLATALATTVFSAAEPVYLISAIALLLYIPLGKIRHCVYYFYTRIIFGRLFGKRGVFPRAARKPRPGVQ